MCDHQRYFPGHLSAATDISGILPEDTVNETEGLCNMASSATAQWVGLDRGSSKVMYCQIRHVLYTRRLVSEAEGLEIQMHTLMQSDVHLLCLPRLDACTPNSLSDCTTADKCLISRYVCPRG